MEYSKIIQRCDRTSCGALYAMIFFLPISTAIVEGLSAFVILPYVFKTFLIFRSQLKKKPCTVFWDKVRLYLKCFNPDQSNLNWPVIAFLGVNFMSSLFSQYHFLSFKGYFCQLTQNVFLYFVLTQVIVTKKRMRILIILVFVALTLMGLNGLNQYLSGKGFIHGLSLMKDYRVRSSFKHANDFASYMVLFAPVVVSGLLLQWYYLGNIFKENGKESNAFINFSVRSLRIWTLLVSVLSFLTIGWSYSRGAWLGFFTALSILGLNIKRAIPLILLSGIVFVNIFLPMMKEARDVSFLTDSVYQYEKGKKRLKGDSVREYMDLNVKTLKEFRGMGRSAWWKEATAIIYLYPVFGSGLNTYSEINKNGGGRYPHNCYLHMAAETGILGLGTFLWILYIVLRDGFRSFRQIDIKSLRFILIGFLAGLAGFLIHSFFDTNFYSVQLGASFWIVIGIIVALQKISLIENED